VENIQRGFSVFILAGCYKTPVNGAITKFIFFQEIAFKPLTPVATSGIVVAMNAKAGTQNKEAKMPKPPNRNDFIKHAVDMKGWAVTQGLKCKRGSAPAERMAGYAAAMVSVLRFAGVVKGSAAAREIMSIDKQMGVNNTEPEIALVICRGCGGTGRMRDSKCPKCGGKGRFEEEDTCD